MTRARYSLYLCFYFIHLSISVTLSLKLKTDKRIFRIYIQISNVCTLINSR